MHVHRKSVTHGNFFAAPLHPVAKEQHLRPTNASFLPPCTPAAITRQLRSVLTETEACLRMRCVTFSFPGVAASTAHYTEPSAVQQTTWWDSSEL